MNLLSPLALLGLLGLGLPLLAHLLGRERPLQIRSAAVRFARPRDPVVRQRRELRDWPLLLLRLLLLALLVLVLARPVVGSQAAVAVLAEPHDAVILVDASGSMELRVDGRSEHARARERVDALLDALPPGSRVGLVFSDPRQPTVEPRPVADAGSRVRAALAEWTEAREGRSPRPGSWSLVEAVPRAAGLLDASGDRPRVIYAVGDPTARGLGSLPPSTQGTITVVPVATRGEPGAAAADSVAHVGISELEWEPAPELDPRAVRIRALVRRYGPGQADDELAIAAALDIGDAEVARARVELGAGGDASVEFTHTLSAAAGEGVRARVRLVSRDGRALDDPLPVDDRRHLWLAASEAVDVLVVNGDPSETRALDEIFFLSTALAESTLGERLDVRGLALDQLEARLRRGLESGGGGLDDVDLLILANVRALPAELAPLIVERVAAGMGLWITVGDRVSAGDYNERFAELLPLLLREAVYAGTAPGRTEARSESLAPVQLSHPIFAGASVDASAGDLELSGTRSRRMFLLEPDPRRGADIALAFSSGAPALITRAHGQGRVALLTTTVDRDWGDLPLRPGFVPLVTRTVAWLARSRGSETGATVAVGARKTLDRSLPYTVTTPSGEVVPVAPRGEGEAAVFTGSDRPGHYEAAITGEEGRVAERFVVTFDAREADTSTLPVAPATLEGEAGTVTIYAPRWRTLALIVLVLLGAESGLRIYLGRRRRVR